MAAHVSPLCTRWYFLHESIVPGCCGCGPFPVGLGLAVVVVTVSGIAMQ